MIKITIYYSYTLFEINNRVDPRSNRTNNSFINLDMLNENGYDSAYAIANVSGVNFNEFVVYEPERVVKWMICYPSKDKFERPTETKPERPDPTCEVDFVEQ